MVLGVLQLVEVVVNPLRGASVAIATLQPVQRDGDVLGLSTPVTFGTDGTKHAGELPGNPPGPRIRNCQFPVGSGF